MEQKKFEIIRKPNWGMEKQIPFSVEPSDNGHILKSECEGTRRMICKCLSSGEKVQCAKKNPKPNNLTVEAKAIDLMVEETERVRKGTCAHANFKN